MSALSILGLIALVMFGFLCLGLVIFGLPGTWFFLAADLIIAAVLGFEKLTIWVLLALLGLALLAELIEFLAGYVGARYQGASRWASFWAIIASFIGAIAMTPLIPIVGSLLGAFLGAFVGAFLAELYQEKSLAQAYQSGLAALLGRIAAIVSKLAVGVAMIVVTVYYLV